ncbi:DNA primase [Candidatus Peregrinibacteria bacterium]|nr:MAG: DNA primase [Candidatus Peregrinibacteria bacterium]
MNHLEEIKSRLSIEELVGQYVQLKKAGRNLRGLCPFHGEKTPSFMVSPEKGIAYCFGCHQGGDIFKFTQLVESIDFAEAVKQLAQKTNVAIPIEKSGSRDKRVRTLQMNEATKAVYQKNLAQHPEHQKYLQDRGLSEESIRQFELGFAPDSYQFLKNQLSQLGFSPKEQLESGVTNQRHVGDENSYDRFRNRLIFPIHDHQGNTVAFSGRVLGEGEPKYLNSPDTPAYNKSTVLYGLNLSKEAIKQSDRAIIVEGYMDAIAAFQIGTKNVVATCGTALTPQQLKLIQRFTQRISLAFDQDHAGMEATLRAIELAQATKLETTIIRIPYGKDPDECIKNHPNEWKKAVENPLSIMDFYFEYALKHHDPNTAQGKKEITELLLPIIGIYHSHVEQNEYVKRLALMLKIDLKVLWQDFERLKARQHNPYAQQNPTVGYEPKKRLFSGEELLLSFLINFPEWIEEVDGLLRFSERWNEEFKTFYNTLKKGYTLERRIDLEAIKEGLSEEDQKNGWPIPF